MADRRLPIPEVVVPGQRLGRHINHDPRSLQYKVAPAKVAETVSWKRHVPAFDQGDLGSCTIQAQLGILATDPYWDTLSPEMKVALADPNIQFALVAPRYREVTRLDPFRGAWEPEDTGSDGLSSAKVAKNHGDISGYMTITTVEAAYTAIKAGSFMSGLMWMSGMDNPNSEGIVHATGTARGGHEWQFAGYDAQRGLWECWQSWGPWGRNGRFYLPDADYANLLGQQGDATTFVPNTMAPPVPTPAPVIADPLTTFPFAQVDAWAAGRKLWWTKRDRSAAEAYAAWRSKMK